MARSGINTKFVIL